jgi:hypothetical protein
MRYRSAHTNCIVRIIPLRGLSAQQEALCLFLRKEAGHCWTDMLNAHIESRSGKWLSSNDLKEMFKRRYTLHSQTIQALAEKLEANVDTALEQRKSDPKARYPIIPRSIRQLSGRRRRFTDRMTANYHSLMAGRFLLSSFPFQPNTLILMFLG